jgi:hypothetical protein
MERNYFHDANIGENGCFHEQVGSEKLMTGILTLCLAGLGHPERALKNFFLWRPADDSLRRVQKVELATGSAVFAFVLRLPELEFKHLFNEVHEWNEAEVQPDSL